MRKVLIIAVVVIGVSCVSTLVTRPTRLLEPAYQGKTVTAHLQTLASGDWELRNDAAAALVAIGPEATPFLVRVLEKRANPIETALLRLQSRLPVPQITPSTTPQLRRCAAEQLGSLGAGDRRAIEALIRAGTEDDRSVVEEAQRALRRLGPAVVPELTAALKSRNARIRRHTAEVLGDFGSRASAAIPDLLRLLQDRDETVRAQAARSLGAGGDPTAVGGLAGALSDRSPAVRTAAADALGVIGASAQSALAKIKTNFNDRDTRARIAAARAFWRIARDADAAVPVLTSALRDPSSGWEASLALGEIGPAAREAVPALVETMKRERVPRPLRGPPSSALALGRIGAAAVPELVKTLGNEEPRIRTAAAIALGFIGEDAHAAAPTLIPLLADSHPEVRQAATLGLGSIDPERRELVPALVVMARDDDIFLSSAAATALQKIDPAAAAAVVRD
ncbi:MAG: HEAT repeat domain-containing protein [Verrucomicrobia subdivision 3 bacterium]|nr:HEAT repeat domain-containing protein [Limisphaerales bacterium]